ncbi:glutamine-hydrolyzing carbamoyl-phosphate synthase small subunit [Legionella micdadei]|uniref:Carbamoyl phosphate synthase small chain n=1 Tax=Legionella micdadei TaxID=451 RepID=A0A098GBM5_LEGMI|nr:glutamine-hydrolyzing carbamoyl-phosphate synthase small subunit [Legionella micdadei]ARG98419.1 carbamoyl phosphate synthase small subunit [Legionella micdadei]ARH01167.1 carbamoyl phosphate synthase small subunit [Legionella micdadei]KTD30374.1 carbamoyl-phosphate synthetase, glutamine (small subunit) [Legionella micdadei]NSL18351.1 glutamine-hydrolyzing carbamoyl-phosphate synthase small subunit [Legionella micdadei]CEG59898.1 Carbamoyl-phosphate synthase small chain [Legionella micdadei
MAFLMLADGTLFKGEAIGAPSYALGEMVFNTSHTGYQEILTDPSYHGQIITFTVPHIGNVGVNKDDNESSKIHAAGAVFRDFSEHFSNWRAQDSLNNFLLKHNLVALSGVDTRALTLHLREKGSQNACLVTSEAITTEKALELARNCTRMKGANLAALVSTKEPYLYHDPQNSKAHIIVVDCGVKQGILKSLAQYPVKISVVPESIHFAEIKALSPDGVLLSNGPGDPESCNSVIQLTTQLLQQQIPVFGICLGHQILALAAGAKTKKMKFGHHGSNHPIKCCKTGAVFISSQNHGFVVDEVSLPDHLEITHTSLFDGTIAGIRHRQAPAFSFQGHPEANPGPNELKLLFNQFIHEVQYAQKY